MKRFPRLGAAAAAVAALAVAALTTGCGATQVTTTNAFSQADPSTVRLVVNSWTGSAANVAVAQYLLEHQLHYKVETTQIDEIPAWNALSTGNADAIMEDWGHADQQKTYVDKQKTVQMGGKLGAVGHIGWYVPKYVADQHPDITSWKNLDKYKKLFMTPESGGKGQLLGGSPSYVTNDPALIKNLGLDYKVVYAGSEAAEIAQIRQAYAKRKPLLFYWYVPQWLTQELAFTEVKLPPYNDKCGLGDPAKINCAYPTYKLDKVFSKAFVKRGGKAYEFLRSFHWTARDQNEVAGLIADKKMTPQDAARQWVQEHPAVWRQWLPKG